VPLTLPIIAITYNEVQATTVMAALNNVVVITPIQVNYLKNLKFLLIFFF
jgi:hypothetical protein